MIPIMGFYGIKLVIDDLDIFPVPPEIEQRAKDNGLAELKYDKLDNFISKVDYLILTRGLQKGIIPPDKFPPEEEEKVLKRYKPITRDHMKRLRKDAFLVMLLPRIFEVDRDVDDDPRAVYSKNEMFVEMSAALLTHFLGIKV